ncbi:MAG: SpoIVB peptidase [Oscillospiraceae bacterium]|nr:SpoIVB peptidase [Oscillospiraceae bacterium]
MKSKKIILSLTFTLCTLLFLCFFINESNNNVPVSTPISTRKYVVVSGEPFGIRLYTDGIVIVGTNDVITKNGKENPAKNCNLAVGDVIKAINGRRVTRNSDLSEAIKNSNGNPIELLVLRNNKTHISRLIPLLSLDDEKYKAGLYIRDSSAGIGTLTFYDSERKTYAGLGHGVCDTDTGEIMPLFGGDAVKATIVDVYKAHEGQVGELCGLFQDDIIGPLAKNTEYGIFGTVSEDTIKGTTYPVAMSYEVKKGKAKLISTIDNNGPKEYDIEITKIYKVRNEKTKSMAIKVTDKNLLSKTGGIIQGMSGSPIIQNGMLVGAVTHVLCEDPAKGYAIYAETMVNME